MMCSQRWMALAVASFLALSIFLGTHLSMYMSMWDQNDAGAYIKDSALKLIHSSHDSEESSWDGRIGDKVVVMAKLESEETDWVSTHLPDWQTAIYHTSLPTPNITSPSALTVPANKGHEAMAYLTYIITHYTSLPSTLAFVHAHRTGFSRAWHTDAPLHDNVAALQSLQLGFIQQNGYANMRCNTNPGCRVATDGNDIVTDEIWTDLFTGTTILDSNSATTDMDNDNTTKEDGQVEEQASVDLRDGSVRRRRYKAPKLQVACCAQFPVSRGQVLRRPREDYVLLREWLLKTELDDSTSGRVFEYVWHVIFGMDGVYCPDTATCQCEVYGRC